MNINVVTPLGNKSIIIQEKFNEKELYDDILNILLSRNIVEESNCNYDYEIRLFNKINNYCKCNNYICLTNYGYDDYIFMTRDEINKLLAIKWKYIFGWIKSDKVQICEYNIPVNIVNQYSSIIIDLSNYTNDNDLIKDIIELLYTNTYTIFDSRLYTIATKNEIYAKNMDFNIMQYYEGASSFPHYTKECISEYLIKYWKHIKVYLSYYKEKFWSEDFRNICHK